MVKIAFVYFLPSNFVNGFLFTGTAAERREYYGQLLGPLVDTVPGVGGQVGSCCVPGVGGQVGSCCVPGVRGQVGRFLVLGVR